MHGRARYAGCVGSLEVKSLDKSFCIREPEPDKTGLEKYANKTKLMIRPSDRFLLRKGGSWCDSWTGGLSSFTRRKG